MFRQYVERGALAGAAGGLAFGLFVAVVGNPLVAAVEETGHGSHGHAAGGHEASAVSETVNSLASVGGGVLWGLLLGAAAFGVVYYFLEPAIPGTGTTKRYLLAAAGFVTVSGAPWLVVPPQPPGVETTLTVGTAQLLYGGMVVAGAAVCLLAGLAYDRLAARVVRPLAAGLALAPFALLAVPAVLVQPGASGAISAEMTAAYRGVVVFGQALLWLVLASTHAWVGDVDSETGVEAVGPDDTASLSD